MILSHQRGVAAHGPGFAAHVLVGDTVPMEDHEVEPIQGTMVGWHAFLAGDPAVPLEDLLHPEVVFWSPVLFRPQHGRDLAAMYLNAAYKVFPGDRPENATGSEEFAAGSFRYTKKVFDGNHAVLEFETQIDGIHVNGVDIVTCDDEGLIVEFKVMLRPFRAIEVARDRMVAVLGG